MSKKNRRHKKPATRKSKTTAAPDSAIQMDVQSAEGVGKSGLISSGLISKSRSVTKLASRRNLIKMIVGIPVVGAAGAAIHRYDVKNRGLHDLSLIGQGKAVVVQVHDPACSLCRQLMNNSRKALVGNDEVLFKVADINTADGEAFRREHHGETVSLILFDAQGRKRSTINGVKTVEYLAERFAQL